MTVRNSHFAALGVTLLASFLFVFTSHALAGSVTEGLKATIDQVLDTVKDPKYKDDRQGRRTKLREIIRVKFDYLEMSRRALARNWRKLSPEQRQEFTDLFGLLMENSYAARIESYRDEKIEYVDEKIKKKKYALVKTLIVRKSDSIPVDYKLIKKGEDWRVYDFRVEDALSLISNFRSQFNGIIKKKSVDVLMEKMRAKIKKLNDDVDDQKDEI